jgi:hypothetical protein
MTSISLILSCAAGFIVNLPGVLVWSEYGTIYAWEKERLGGSALEIMTWDPEHSAIIFHVKAMVIQRLAANYWSIVVWNPLQYFCISNT